MKLELLERIIDRAKTRKDGVYVYDCIKYAVKSYRLLFLIDFNEVFQFSNGFLVSIGKVDRFNGRSKLKELMSKEF